MHAMHFYVSGGSAKHKSATGEVKPSELNCIRRELNYAYSYRILSQSVVTFCEYFTNGSDDFAKLLFYFLLLTDLNCQAII